MIKKKISILLASTLSLVLLSNATDIYAVTSTSTTIKTNANISTSAINAIDNVEVMTTDEASLAIQSYGAVPTKKKVDFQKDELTAFIHYGINTFTDREWGNGTESPSLFNPTDLDADQWVATLAESGFKKVILTAKHHDGFSLWDTANSTFDVASSPWKNGKGDVLKDVSEACAKYGLKFGVYLSPWDQNSADYGEGRGGDYNEYYMNQIRELCTNYGKISEFWMDGAKGSNVVQEYKFSEWFNLIYELQPDCVIFSPEGPDVRWIGNENGYAGETCWSTIDVNKMRASEIPSYLNTGEENGPNWIVGESDVSIRPGWFYHASQDNEVKSLERLMDIYYKSVGRNSILLLNTPPDKRGKLADNDVNRIKEFGNAVKQTFDEDLAVNKVVAVNSFNGNSENYNGSKLVDNDYDTYWAPDAGAKTGSIEIDLNGEKDFDVISLQEYIPLGQRVKSFDIEIFKNNEWKKISQGTTIGYKKLIRVAPTKASKIRINIKDSLATPTINNVGVYKQPTNVELPAGPPEGLKLINDGEVGTTLGKFNFSAGWVYEAKDGNYGSDGHYSTTAGSTTILKFRGTKLYLLGTKDPGHGIMEVSIDGEPPVDVDLYSATRQNGVVVFETGNLTDAEHTIQVKTTGRKNTSSRGTASYVDGALVLDNGGKGLFEFENINYSVKENVGKASFKVIRKGGSTGSSEVNYETLAGTALDAEDYVRWSGTLTFNEGETEKIVEVTIIDDKKNEGQENFFIKLADPMGGALVGFKNQTNVAIEDNEIIKINTTDRGTEINKINFIGTWNYEIGGAWTANKAATFETKFLGKKITLIGAKDPNHGVYQISIDGGEYVDANAYAASRVTEQTIFTSSELPYGEHTLRFKISQTNPNPGRGDTQLNYLIVDSSMNDVPIEPSADINRDQKVDIGDLALLSKYFNQNKPGYDIIVNGKIDDEDINYVIDKILK